MDETTTYRILEQGQALVRAIEALETIEPTGPIERIQAWFLLQADRHRSRAIVEASPEWMVEQILSASQHIDEDRAAVWLSENWAMLDELTVTLEEIWATVRELDTQLGDAYDACLVRVVHRLYRFGCRLQGEDLEPYDGDAWDQGR